MKFRLTSKTESEFNPGKVQMHFRILSNGQSAETASAPAAPQTGLNPPPGGEVNLSGLWDKTEADLYDVGKTYSMALTEVTESA